MRPQTIRSKRTEIIWIPFLYDEIRIINAARVLMDGRTAMAKFLKEHFKAEADWIADGKKQETKE